MKQKFTIKIADIEMNIISEGSADEVEATVSKVDRRIREICQKSPRLSKHEAAILTALEFCAQFESVNKDIKHNDEEFQALQEENSKILEENAKLADAVEKLTVRLNAQKEKYESAAAAQKERYESAAATLKEKYEGRIEIMKEKYESRITALRAKLDEMAKKASLPAERKDDTEPAGEDGTRENKEENTAPETFPPEQITVESVEKQQDAEEIKVDAAEAKDNSEKKEARPKTKNSKVGAMFELLTFNDV